MATSSFLDHWALAVDGGKAILPAAAATPSGKSSTNIIILLFPGVFPGAGSKLDR